MVAAFFSILLRKVCNFPMIVGMFLLLLCTHMASTSGRSGGRRQSTRGGGSQLSGGSGGLQVNHGDGAADKDGTRDYFLAIGATVGFIGAFIVIYICICMCIKDKDRQ